MTNRMSKLLRAPLHRVALSLSCQPFEAVKGRTRGFGEVAFTSGAGFFFGLSMNNCKFSLAPFGQSALIDPHLMEAALKTEYTKEFKLHEKDTGSADVQIALLTHRINDLTKHLQKFKKDHSSRRGLLMMVAQRKKLQDYLKQSDAARYDKVIQKLNLRK